MKTKYKVINHILVFFLIFNLCIPRCMPAFAAEERKTFQVTTEKDLITLARLCSSDMWSKQVIVVLEKDIVLTNQFRKPITSFGGIFYGNGYTISNLNVHGAFSPAGLFSEVQDGAIIQDLNVKGKVMPTGIIKNTGGIVGKNNGKIIRCTFTGTVIGETNTGGIVGSNEASGELYQCSAYGVVTGKSHTGGVVGNNTGSINHCENKSAVNIKSIDPTLSIDDINLDYSTNLKEIMSISNLENVNIATDTGGIAGYSNGMVLSSTNYGTIGYHHIGYNVGGVTGRSSGFLSNCKNYGKIYGRKDVGGITGQSEPYMSLMVSEDSLKKLKSELTKFQTLVDQTADSMDSSTNSVTNRFKKINNYLTVAMDSTKKLQEEVSDYTDGTIKEINRLGSVGSDVIIRLEKITDQIPNLSDTTADGLDKLEDGIQIVSDAAGMGEDTLSNIKSATKEAKDAINMGKDGINKVSNGIDLLQNAVQINDKEAAHKSLDEISDGMTKMIESVQMCSNKMQNICKILKDHGWTEDALQNIREFAEELDEIGKTFSKIHDAVKKIDDNLDVDWDSIHSVNSEFSEALDAFIDAADSIEEALEQAQLGMTAIQNGLIQLEEAVSIKDEEEVTDAITQIVEGIEQCTDALDSMNTAIQKLSDILSKVNDWGDLEDQKDEITDALLDLGSALGDASDALTQISEGLTSISDNIVIDEDQAGEGTELIIDGFEELEGSIEKFRNANTTIDGALQHMKDGLVDLQNGVQIKDEEAIHAAFEEIQEAFGTISSVLQQMSTTLEKMADTMKDMLIWGDLVVDEVSNIADAIADCAKSIDKINQGINSLRKNVSVDSSQISQGIDMIQEGLDYFVKSADHIESSLDHMSESAADLKETSNKASEGLTMIADSVGIFQNAADEITKISKDVHELFQYLSNVDPVQLKQPSEKINQSADKLNAAGIGISSQLDLLSDEISTMSGDVSDNIKKMSSQFMVIVNLIIDSIYQVEDGSTEDIISDTSDIDINDVTYGKALSCVNYGYIYADLNVGGIAGSMAIEYELDPEDDVAGEGSSSFNKIYETKAIIQKSVNMGEVIARNDCVSCICGKMDLGIIIESEAYGSAKSENGDNVGGIAGISSSKIKNSWAKCTLSGKNYIGGIVGTGNQNEIIGSDCVVSGCKSMVQITKFDQFAGAISGFYSGHFKSNYFVSETLHGIDRLNYQGKASRISYETLLLAKNLPEELHELTLSFIVEGKNVKSLKFAYGDSFDESIFPQVSEKEGYYCDWDKDILHNLKFDTVVHAEYKQFETTLSSKERRNDGRVIFFTEGKYTSKDKVGVIKVQSVSQPIPNKGKVLEQWKLTIPEDGEETHLVRYLPEREETKGIALYIKSDNKWEKLEYHMVGSYLCFDTKGQEIELLVVQDENNVPIVIMIASLAAVMMVITIIRKRRKHKNR